MIYSTRFASELTTLDIYFSIQTLLEMTVAQGPGGTSPPPQRERPDIDEDTPLLKTKSSHLRLYSDAGSYSALDESADAGSTSTAFPAEDEEALLNLARVSSLPQGPDIEPSLEHIPIRKPQPTQSKCDLIADWPKMSHPTIEFAIASAPAADPGSFRSNSIPN